MILDKISVQQIAEFIGGKLIGKDLYITSATTDSREAKDGAMFIGIKGERADGNDFATDFLKKGGSCAVVEKDIDVPDGKCAIRVDDTKKAIRDIAEFYRTQLDIQVVAVTGSVGKTSTKDMLNSVISQSFKTFATKGNFNNEIGVPLTIFQLDSSYSKAVVEMGMSNLGEISRLTKIAKPQVAVITNIGTSHIGNLGSRENILKAKLEVLECLEGVAILNGDDEYLWGAKEKITHKTIYYGIENKSANYLAYDVKCDDRGSSFKVKIDGAEQEFYVPVVGLHHVYNAMAAIICGLHFGMKVDDIAKGVGSFATSGMRQRELQIGNIKLIEDCYNASADSMKSSLNVLKSVSANCRSIAVLGDMLEQGEFAEENHRIVGKYAVECDVDTLVCVGNDMTYTADEAKKGGVCNVYKFDTNKETAEFLCKYVKDRDVVLFKASRGMRLEEVSASLQEFLKGRD